MKRIVLIADHRPRSLSRTLVGVALLAGAVVLGATQTAPVSTPPAQPTPPVKIPPVAARPEMSAEMQAQIAAARAERTKWEEELQYELLGIGLVAGVPVALIDAGGNLCAVMTNGHIIRYSVAEIDVEHKRVSLSRPGEAPKVLALTTSNPIRLPEMNERQVEFLLSKESIKRMNGFHGMPGELHMVWDKVSREGQVEVLFGYLRRGLVVGATRDTGTTSKLLERQMSERARERHEVFMASLTPGQKARYNLPQQAIRFTDPPAEREKQMAAAKTVQAQRDEVIANLTPEQRALYDEYRSWMQP